MNVITSEHVRALARGKSLPREAFLAIFRDPEALQELNRLLQVRDLLCPIEEAPPTEDLPAMDVSFQELADFVEGRLHDQSRAAAVRRFLGAYLPKALPEAPSSADTTIEGLSGEARETEISGLDDGPDGV